MLLNRSEIFLVLLISLFFVLSCSSSDKSTPPPGNQAEQPPQGEESDADGNNINDNAEAKLKQERLLRFVMD